MSKLGGGEGVPERTRRIAQENAGGQLSPYRPAVEARRYPRRSPRHPFSAAQLAHVERRLAVCPSIRATDLHHELQSEYGYASSYWTFPRQLVPLRPPVLAEPEVRFETAPGVQTQAD